MIENKGFIDKLNPVEKRAFVAADGVIKKFLGNTKSDDYVEVVREMIAAFKLMKVNMSLKIHFLNDHLDYFPDNLGAVSDEQGERFHTDILSIESRYKGKNHRHMLGQYCWLICRNADADQLNRKSKQNRFLTMP